MRQTSTGALSGHSGRESLELMFYTLNNVEHVVAQFFGFSDKVHKEYTFLIVIFFIIDIKYVAVAKFVSEIVDFALFIISGHNA